MKIVSMFKSTRARVALAATSILATVSASSHAALAAEIKTAVQDGFADAQEASGLMVIGFAALFAVMLVMRLFKR